MATRIAIFVDGSNLSGSMRNLRIKVNDYSKLYLEIFNQAKKQVEDFDNRRCDDWVLSRVYWYVVGSMDDWDFASPNALTTLRDTFEKSKYIRKPWIEEAKKSEGDENLSGDALNNKSWELCVKDFQSWYQKKRELLDGQNRFYYSVERELNFCEIKRVGHWKVDLFGKRLAEKGLDTSFAVDMVTMIDNYDVALLVSGDADGIPSIQFAKNAGKSMGTVEFLAGTPPESRGRNYSSNLRAVSDFTVPIFETDLERSSYCSRDTKDQ